MKLALMSLPAAGKSFLSHRLAEHYNLKHISIGDLRRLAAEKRGMSIAEFNKLGESEDTDTEFDEVTKNLSSEDEFIIDADLSALFLPEAIKIFVKASDEARARRLMAKDPNHTRIGENPQSVEEAAEMNAARVRSDKIRYEKHYNFNPFDESHYDIVFDTTNIGKEESVAELIKRIERKV